MTIVLVLFWLNEILVLVSRNLLFWLRLLFGWLHYTRTSKDCIFLYDPPRESMRLARKSVRSKLFLFYDLSQLNSLIQDKKCIVLSAMGQWYIMVLMWRLDDQTFAVTKVTQKIGFSALPTWTLCITWASPRFTVDILILLGIHPWRNKERKEGRRIGGKIVTIVNLTLFFYVQNGGHFDCCLYSVGSYVSLTHVKL
jgi:hypothetical protein